MAPCTVSNETPPPGPAAGLPLPPSAGPPPTQHPGVCAPPPQPAPGLWGVQGLTGTLAQVGLGVFVGPIPSTRWGGLQPPHGHLPSPKDAEIVRTREPQLLAQCDVVVDVGGEYDPQRHRYDHHQR